MSTKRLFEDTVYQREFDATVLKCSRAMDRWAVILDRTLFYPNSGGQPADRGRIGDVRVLDVTMDGETIVHHTDGALPEEAAVHGVIDWERRFDHMQQHSGQHILSQAFYRQAKAETVGFHLGETFSTIDLDLDLDEEKTIGIEEEANTVVFENRTVRSLIVSGSGISKIPMRKPPPEDPARVIEIEDFDFVGCCGTHVGRTGDVGMIKILRTERYKGGTRVTFVCGKRALGEFRKKNAILREVGRRFHIGEDDLAGTLQNLLEDRKSQSRRIRELIDIALAAEAERLIGEAERFGAISFVHALFPDRDAQEVQMLVRNISKKEKTVILAACTGDNPTLFLARSKDIDLDVRPHIERACGMMSGRGGGGPSLAQAVSADIPGLEKAFSSLREALLQFLHSRT